MSPKRRKPVLKFGILGIGRYGAKIRAKLEGMGEVSWAANSESDFTTLEIPDWAFIATPNILHYEQVEFFLKAGAAVFVEKPATLDPRALEDLIDLSKKQGKHLYIDDVFLYRLDLKSRDVGDHSRRFQWHKRDSIGNGSLLDRLAYHHLYLLHESFHGQVDFKLGSYTRFNGEELRFEADINGQTYNFSYSASEHGKNSHIAFGKTVGEAPNDALSDMLVEVLNGTASFDKNQQRALWVTSRISEIRKAVYQNIGIVGGGIFGCTAAVELANHGYNVVLYERHENVMQEASSINQYRVHEGYHYPRSSATAVECKTSAAGFAKYYKQSIVPKTAGIEHYYAIASQSSMTSAKQFVVFMDEMGLLYKKKKPIPGSDLTIEARENIFDPVKLASVVTTRLKGAGVELQLGRAASEEDVAEYDFTVVATYANLNDWCRNKRAYQYELCEKPVLKLPDAYRTKSIVVMDGPFMCIDPLGSTGFHVMGNVVHAIHHTGVGYKPVVPDQYEGLLNKGIVQNPTITHIDKFIESARQFFPDIDQAQHIGSMYTIRTVLPNREKDDARPTLVEWIEDNRVMVFSGKICTCLNAAKTVISGIRARIRTGAIGRELEAKQSTIAS